MIKVNKKFISGVLVGSFLFGGIGVTAVTLNANQVTYSPSDESFNVSNTGTAIDALYELAKNADANIVLLGTLGSSFNLTGYEGYQNFIVGKNIFFIPVGLSVSVSNSYTHTNCSSGTYVGGANSSGFNSSLITYNASTGIVTTSTSAGTGTAQVKEFDGHGYNCDAANASASASISGNVYLIY